MKNNNLENVSELLDDNYYEGTIFHRVIDKFMIQTGGYKVVNNTLEEMGAIKPIKGEFNSNGVVNNLKHQVGVLSMARTMIPNSAGSQFFIMVASAPHLDGQYAAFGKVFAGFDTLDKIATVKTDGNDRPLTEQKIKSIKFITVEKAE
jgi:peptidyl-prolyl cis-trans isomerase B (cyclophilin B)